MSDVPYHFWECGALANRHRAALDIIRRFRDGWQLIGDGDHVDYQWYLEPGTDDAVPETDDLGIQPLTDLERAVLFEAKDPDHE